jgi:hypothetical protein
MKKCVLYPLLIGLTHLSMVFPYEFEERLPRPEEAKSYDELKSTIDTLGEERKQSELARDNATKPSEIQKEKDRIKLIDYGLAKAKVAETNFLLGATPEAKEEAAKKEGFASFNDYQKNALDNEAKLRLEIESQLGAAQRKLAGEIRVSPTSQELGKSLSEATNTLNDIFFSRPGEVSWPYLTQIKNFTDTIDTVVNIQSLINEADGKQTIDEKLGVFSKPRSSIVAMQQSVEDEIESVNKQLKAAPNRNDLNDYLQSLGRMRETVIARLNEIDQKQLEMAGIPEKPSFFKSLFDNVVNIVNNLRAAFSRAIPLPDQIISQINKARNNLAPVANIVGAVDGLTNRAQQLINQATVESRLKVNAKAAITDFTRQQLQDLRTTLRNLEGQFSPDDQNKISEIYQQLQKLSGDINALALQRNKADYPTLFDKLYDYYSSDSIFGGTGFGPNEAYEALGLKPGASDAAITQARAQTAQLNVGTPRGLAARNAGFLLGNPVSKKSYDAFLNDFNKLKAARFDPADKNKSDIVKKQLTETTAVQVDDKTATRLTNEVWPVFEPVFSQSGFLRSDVGYVGDFPPIFTRIGDITKQIDDILGQ